MYIKRVTYKEIQFYSESIVKSETWNQSEPVGWRITLIISESENTK